MNLSIASIAPKLSGTSSIAEGLASTSTRIEAPTPSADKPAASKSATVTSASVDPDELMNALAAANRKLAADSREIRFEFDGSANKLIVRLIDTGTHEVLRQFPTDEALRLARLVNAEKPILNTLA